MPSAGNPVSDARQRCDLLANLIRLEHERAVSDPKLERYIELGIIEPGPTSRKEALQKVEKALTDLSLLINHLTILDMAAAFEGLFRKRIGTAIGAARKTLAERHRNVALAGRASLVRETEDFQGLDEITKLLEADLSQEVKEQLKQVRLSRNRFVHGTALEQAPSVQGADAHDALNAAIELLLPVS